MATVADPRFGPLPRETAAHGCFETMRAYEGRIFRLDAHLDRLYASAQFLGTRPPPDRRRFARQLTQALARSGLREAVVRVALLPSVRRRSGRHPEWSRGMPQERGPSSPSIVVQPVRPPPASAYRRGLRVAIVPARKFSVASITPQAKYSARLGSVLAIIDAQLRGVDEALFMDALGYVTESTASNFGIIRKGALLLPPCWLGLLSGITRDVLFEIAARLRLSSEEVPLTRHEVYNANEAFLTSTIKEVLPVTWVDGRRIGHGRPGPVTRRLRRAFRQLVHQELSS